MTEKPDWTKPGRYVLTLDLEPGDIETWIVCEKLDEEARRIGDAERRRKG